MTQAALAVPETSTDQNIDPQVRAFLKEVNKDPSPFWELPGPQVRATLTGLQDKYPVDMSGVTIADKSIDVGGRTVKLYIMKPEKTQGTLPVIFSYTAACGSQATSRTTSDWFATLSSARARQRCLSNTRQYLTQSIRPS